MMELESSLADGVTSRLVHPYADDPKRAVTMMKVTENMMIDESTKMKTGQNRPKVPRRCRSDTPTKGPHKSFATWRLVDENEGLKANVLKLDNIMYGHNKSQSKRIM